MSLHFITLLYYLRYSIAFHLHFILLDTYYPDTHYIFIIILHAQLAYISCLYNFVSFSIYLFSSFILLFYSIYSVILYIICYHISCSARSGHDAFYYDIISPFMIAKIIFKWCMSYCLICSSWSTSDAHTFNYFTNW